MSLEESSTSNTTRVVRFKGLQKADLLPSFVQVGKPLNFQFQPLVHLLLLFPSIFPICHSLVCFLALVFLNTLSSSKVTSVCILVFYDT